MEPWLLAASKQARAIRFHSGYKKAVKGREALCSSQTLR